MDREQQEFNKLTGKYKHWCPEWDYLPIDETCPEYSSCSCFNNTPAGEKE